MTASAAISISGERSADSTPPDAETGADVNEGTGVVADLAADIVLTEDTIERWIATTRQPEVRMILAGVDSHEARDDPSHIRAVIGYASGSAELGKAVEAHGFGSAKEWSGTTARILAGFVPAAMGTGLEIIKGLGIDETSASYLDAKAEMDKEVRRAAKVLGTVTPEEQKLVAKHLDQITKALELATDEPAGENTE